MLIHHIARLPRVTLGQPKKFLFKLAFLAWFSLLLSALVWPQLSLAQAPSSDTSGDNEENAARTALREISEKGTRGPAKITLRDQAILNLPDKMIFADTATGKRFMEALGNQVDEKEFIGLIMPSTGDWMMTIDFVKDGYVSDEESAKINADDLLKSLQEGTEASNSFRTQQGLAPIEVTGWAELPNYNKARHALTWSALARAKGTETAAGEQTVNYNTRLLGREGYFSITLIDDQMGLTLHKDIADHLIADTEFDSGKRYADFNASTDKVAEYGLLALIGGVAAKKLGLMAVLGIWLVKMWKLVALGAAGVMTAIRKFFKKST